MDFVKAFGLVTLSIPLFVIVTRYYSDKQKKKSQQEEEEEQEQVELEEEAIINVSWSELVPDVLGEIVSRLRLTDQARFLVVCNNWLSAVHPIINNISSASSSSLPWHGCIITGRGTSQFQIFDPLSSHPASIQNISLSNLGIPSPSAVCLASLQHNWLFLSFTKTSFFYWSRRYSLLFSPLTKKVITLPQFHHPSRLHFTSAFSTQPDSPDCVYCMIDAYYTDKISVITYRNGDKQWTAREFNKVPGFRSCIFQPLILHGIIYIVSRFGQVASYNILNGEFSFDRLSEDRLFVQNASSKRRFKLFVLNQEPMILYYDPDPNKNVTRPGKQCIKRYDRSRKVWIPATTLLGYTLFFSQNIFNVSLINTKGRTNNGVLSNKIYHFVNGGCHVYSLQNGNLVRFKYKNSNLLEELPEYKYNYGIPDTKNISAYWLKTPCVRSSSDNQGNCERANVQRRRRHDDIRQIKEAQDLSS